MNTGGRAVAPPRSWIPDQARDERRADLDLATLGTPMHEGELSLEPMAEAHREALKAACAEDPDIWPIYATSYDPDHFDAELRPDPVAAELARLSRSSSAASWSG